MGSPEFMSFDPVALHAAARPDKLAVVDLETNRRSTYAELNARIDRAASFLLAQPGVTRGARIAMLARNCSDILVAHYACLRAGLVLQPLNWRLSPSELVGLVKDASPALLVHEAEFDTAAEAIGQGAPSLPRLRFVMGEDPFPLKIPFQQTTPLGGDDAWTLLYTSGTTGKPKGAIITPRAGYHTGANFGFGADLSRRAVFLNDMPMFHVVGLFTVSASTLVNGGTLLISTKFDPAQTMARIRELGVTHYFCVPAMAKTLREHPAYDAKALRKLVCFGTGGAPNPAALVRAYLDDGVPMVDGYGATEAGTVLCMPLGDLKLLHRKAGSSGVPPLNVRVRLVDTNGNDVKEGEVGEIWLKTPSGTPGYWNQPEATANAYADGWLRTGDAARRDEDGFYFLVDRWKDMFISGGENVYPAEAEAAIAELDEVLDAAIIGVPDERWGEVGHAFVIVAPGQAIASDAVIAHCRARLAAYKAPKSVEFVDALPRTGSGKVQKNVLRDQWRAAHGAA